MTIEMILEKIEKITRGKRFINEKQLKEIELLPYVYMENCGPSGTGDGTLYTLYMMDNVGEKTNKELMELILTY